MSIARVRVGVCVAMLLAGSLSLPALLAADFGDETKIVGSVPFGRLGAAVAIDGDTAVIGAPEEECPAGFTCGAVHVWVNDGAGWSLEASLAPSDQAMFQRFGTAVDISGDVIAVGSVNGDAYVFERTGTIWSETAILTATGQTSAYGGAVAVDADTILVGDVASSIVQPSAGAAFVFGRSGSTWVEVAALGASDGSFAQGFGGALDLDGSRALVGASSDGHAGSSSGAAYVFNGAGSVWTESAKLTASDAGANHHFGCSVALDGGRALVGTACIITFSPPEAAYMFVDTGGDIWVEEQRLTSSDGAVFDSFGGTVALDGDTALIGARGHALVGAGYIFERSGGSWNESQKLMASDGVLDDLYTTSAALNGQFALVGAPGDQCSTGEGSCGAVYIYEGSPPALQLTTFGVGVCPGLLIAGVAGATPGNPVVFLVADQAGVFEIQPPATCAGTVFDLESPSLLTIRAANGQGNVLLFRPIGFAACGKLLQVGDGASCKVSNVVTLPE